MVTFNLQVWSTALEKIKHLYENNSRFSAPNTGGLLVQVVENSIKSNQWLKIFDPGRTFLDA